MFKKTPAYIKYSKRRMSLRKKRRYILIAVLAAVIIAALAGTYYLVHYANKPLTSYQEMDDASLPTITCHYQDDLINRLYGYKQEMNAAYMRDTLYILQDTYSFDIHIENSDDPVMSVKYRVVDLPGNNLIQDADASDTITENGDAYEATLQIENMIEADKEYSLEIILTRYPGENIHYYTRILRTSAPFLTDHMALIKKLHDSTFDYDAAEEAFSPYKSESDYLYDDTTSFNRITLYSSISWLSWDEMDISETIRPTINIVDYDGELAFFRTDYQVGCELDSALPQYYNVSEFYRTRINETNAFLLDYERNAAQIFYPSGDLVFSDHINLGILSEDNISSMASPNGNQTVFAANKALWMMSAQTKELTSIYNYVSDYTDVRDTYDQHDIRIVSVTDEGDVRFLVYGYVNKGLHEGKAGIGLYTFRFRDLKVTEDAFIPSEIPYQLLKYSIGDLCYMNSEGTLYIMINGTVYSIDPETKEAVKEIEGLTEETRKVSEDSSMIAWQPDGHENDSTVIKVLNMETLQTYEVDAEDGKCIKALGFLNDDLIYGQGDSGMVYTDTGGKELLMMDHMYALDTEGTIQNDTTEEGYYFTGAEQEYNRLILNRVTEENDSYQPAEDFTIFSTELNEYPSSTIYTAMEETRGLVTLLSLPETNSASTPLNIIVSTAVIFSSNEVADIDPLDSKSWTYLVYAKGRLISPEENAAAAVNTAYENTGCVVNTDGSYFYRRGMRAAAVEIPQEIIDAAIASYRNELALNITGVELAQAMSFIARRNPMIWEYNDNVYVIAGYTTSDALILYNIDTGETTYMSFNEADRVFTKEGRVFVYENK